MELVKVNEKNFAEIIGLKTKAEKKGYVDSALYSIAECFVDKNHMEAFGIYNDKEIYGFVSIYFEKNFGQIINFFIEDNYQNKGYGGKIVEKLLEIFSDIYKVDTVSVGVHKENIRAFNFWKKLGFIDTGNIEGDYRYLRKPLKRKLITDDLYLTKYFPAHNISLNWYLDKETVKMVDNSDTVYELDQLNNMYEYLDKNGILFYIVYKNKLIGDCAIFDDKMVAIVIDKEYRGKGIASKVLEFLISYARDMGYENLNAEIYDFNMVSKNLFAKYGFKNTRGNIYSLSLN